MARMVRRTKPLQLLLLVMIGPEADGSVEAPSIVKVVVVVVTMMDLC